MKLNCTDEQVLFADVKLSDTFKVSDSFWSRTVKLLKIKNFYKKIDNTVQFP
ncbi:hypothetical protein U14_05971 [Candidatus Moduliflexus flocculans]|uniref:Uncharacterized protein n=1 Tax=Candidatus Moduliflexus flocculans TaxID=1499966 RepID=A0A081BTF2_9BACT|nr:hypothetical protein U14_05971 [Candidatus Moduliflexus flocculans]